MSFDSSRFTFKPWRDFLGVVMEQGRVQLDSDWNEWQAEFTRRLQAGTLDTIGPAAYPANITPNAFQITASGSSGNQITIGAGRYYVDGFLAENHGTESAAAWDPALAELSGAPFIQPFSDVTVNYTGQPYYPNAPAIKDNGPYLVYLDVWQREVTYLEDPWIIDKAVGVDTSGRLQTVWQVKLLDISSMTGSIDCATDIPLFDQLIQPSAGLLTNNVVNNTPSGPCCLAANTGYTGLENQLYRVEIHQGGAKPTFKWSRDNASVATSVTAISTVMNSSGANVSQLTVASLGRDTVLGFNNGDWIEITDDYQELNGLPGELHKIAGTSPPALTITLASVISLSLDPSDASRHTRIVRWDQQSDAIKVPLDGSPVTLESGITVSFSLNPSSGQFYSGDFWNFAARTADGSIEPLTNAPPRGIHHHYAKLAIVTFPNTVTDCRVAWPPAPPGCCCCTVSVQPSDITATNTLQSIVDKYKNQPAATIICLAPGTYNLSAPLRLTQAHTNMALTACPPGTAILQAQSGQQNQFSDGLVVLDGVTNITLSGLKLEIPVAQFPATTFAGLPVSNLATLVPDVVAGVQTLAAAIGVRPVNATNVTIEDCLFDLSGLGENLPSKNSYPFGAGIFACGQCTGMQVKNNQFQGAANIRTVNFQVGFLLAPSVSFNAPEIFNEPPWEITHVPAGDLGALNLDTSAFQLAAKPTAAQKAARTADLQTRLAIVQKPDSGQTVAPVKPVISKLAPIDIKGPTPSASNLAANGGAVLPAILNNATFSENSFSGLTFAVLTVGEPEFVEFLANQVTGCAAGFWLMSPLQLTYLFNLAEDNIGILPALAYPLPQGDTSTAVQVPAAPASVRIFAGASSFTDTSGNVWSPDATKSSTFTLSGKSTLDQPDPGPKITDPGGAPDPNPALYQSERYGSSFTYTFNSLPAGFYLVTLRFAELTFQGAGDRVFNVSINGQQVLTNFDIYADAGGEFTADEQLFPNILPNAQGQIVLEFTATTNYASISAIEIDPQWDLASLPDASSTGELELLNFFFQLEQLAEQGYAGLTLTPPQLRVQDNEMQGLPSACLMILGDDSVMNANVSSLLMTGNRLSSTINNETFLEYLESMARVAPSAEVNALVELMAFFCTVTIIQVSQCLVSANMILNASKDTSVSFVLNDDPVASPQLAVMSNLFKGFMAVIPKDYPATALQAAPQGCTELLNTMIP